MRLRTIWVLILVSFAPLLCSAVGNRPEHIAEQQAVLVEREHRVLGLAIHDSEFAAISRSTVETECADLRPPEPLATPNPSLDEMEVNPTLSVSFIVDTDGRVLSALIMESAGPNQNQSVLAAVQSWRYRPTLCNGVPIDAEATVKFYVCHKTNGCPADGPPNEYLSQWPGTRDRRRTDPPRGLGITGPE